MVKPLLTVLICAGFLFVSNAQQPTPIEDASKIGYSRTAKTIETIGSQLSSGRLSISDVLTDTSLFRFHSIPLFREVIKKNAKPERIRMTSPSEPGIKITVEGKVLHSSGDPVEDALVYVYQTSDKGWYSDTAAHIRLFEGDMRHARLFGYMKTDTKGKFSFETIRPGGYPRSDFPAHIHIAMWDKNEVPIYGIPAELLFEEDERLTPARKKEALQNGFLISKNTGTRDDILYEYQIVLRNE